MHTNNRTLKRRRILLKVLPTALVLLLVLSGAAALAEDSAAAAEERTPRTWYEVFVYSYCDSDGDGTGDLAGLTSKLPYIKDMGFTGLWLMPIHPSPTYHKYDVCDYMAVDPQYGTMDDFTFFMEECDRLGLDVILDLVLNHTSSKHPWFMEALDALEEGNLADQYVGYYHFEEREAAGSWYAAGNGYAYEAPFWSEMPDLNLDNPLLREEISMIARFWLDKGVDGFRLDAVKEYTSGDTQKNIETLKWITQMVRDIKEDVYLVGENWENSELLYEYYEGIDSLFNFPFATSSGYIARALIADNGSNAQRLVEAIVNAEELIREYGGELATDAPFFINHDNARAAGFLRRNADLIKMAWGVNLMMSGDAFVYYGEEIGMPGSGIDENKRAPMQWSADGIGMTAGPPNMETLKYTFAPVDEQLKDEASILNFIKKAVGLRKEYPAIAFGRSSVINNTAAPTVGVIEKAYGDENIVLLFNLSGEEQYTEPMLLDGARKSGIADWLSAGDEPPVYNGLGLTMPPYTIVIMN
ncbi:MAG: hypothetical protein LBD16_09385 [Oscillospiraceae bacterium]|nr:hypothetical protein [Oscillospiraceae bacterium]